MSAKYDHTFTPAELAASLERLGVRELEERMEVSPLLAAPDDGLPADETPTICCSCKMGEEFGEDGSLPYPQVDPGPTSSPVTGTY